MRFKQFLKRFQLEYLLRVVRDAFVRFPFSVLCAAAATALSMLSAHEFKPLSEDNLSRMLLFLCMGLVFFTALRLYAEGSKVPRVQEATMTGVGAAALLALAFAPDHFTTMHGFIMSALALSMLFAPYIGRNSTEDSVWYFNYLNGVSLAVAGLSTFILCLGLCAIIGSMDYLLYDMKLSGKIYLDIWIFGGMFFGPVMFMHQLSRQFDFEKGECALLPGIYFIANFLVVPLILIYMWVLYVYFLKMGVQWELPKGNLAYMVTGFGALGVAARLAVFPMRDTGTKLLQQFYKYFYHILVVPVLLLAIGLYTRVSQYGVTEDRYAIAICLFWLAGLTAWNIAKPKTAHLKHVPMVLACLFLLGAIGPWGAVSVSALSQTARLESLLEKAGVIGADGKIAKVTQEVPFALRKEISSVLEYMFSGKEEKIRRWTEPFRAEIEKKHGKDSYDGFERCGSRSFTRCWAGYSRAERMMEAWGMQYVHTWQSGTANEYVTITVGGQYWNDENILKISPYTHVIRLSPAASTQDWKSDRAYREDAQDKFRVSFTMNIGGQFFMTLPDGRRASFDLQAVAETLHKEKIKNLPEEQRARAILRDSSGGIDVELRPYTLSGRLVDGKLKLESASLLVLFSL